MRHFARFVIALAMVMGAAIAGSLGAIQLLKLKRWVIPTGPMSMGDLESPVVAMGGFLIGLACGLMWTTYRLRRFWPAQSAATAGSEVPLPGPLQSVRGYRWFVAFSIAAILGGAAVSSYFGVWELTWNWTFPLDSNKIRWMIWQSANVVAPLTALLSISRSARFHLGEMLFIWLSFFSLVATISFFHLPGQYQQIAGGLPNGEPNGSYGLGLIACCVLQWGIILATAAVIFGLAMGRRATANRARKKSPLPSLADGSGNDY